MSESTAHLPVFSSITRPIATPATGALSGTPASISASAPPQTDAIDDEPFDSRMSETMRTRVGELSRPGQQRHERALGERAVADFAPAGAAQELHFAHRERREVVVQHEVLVRLAVDHLDLLRVVFGAERGADERLRLAAREHDRAVNARQHAGFDPDRTDLVEAAAVEPLAALEDLVAHDLLFEPLEDVLGVASGAAFALPGCDADQLVQHLVDACRSSRACP